jgi:hypothetical protein
MGGGAFLCSGYIQPVFFLGLEQHDIPSKDDIHAGVAHRRVSIAKNWCPSAVSQPSYLICFCGTPANQLLPNPERCLHILLLDSLHPDKPHPSRAHGFADRLPINAIILVALGVRFDELSS